MSKGFEDLEVWQKAKNLAVKFYVLSKSFPKEDQFGITSQMRRSSFSIPSNIAEGSAKSGDKEFLRYTSIAQGSCAEFKTQLIIAKEIRILPEKDFADCILTVNDIGKMLKGLERRLKEKQNK